MRFYVINTRLFAQYINPDPRQKQPVTFYICSQGETAISKLQTANLIDTEKKFIVEHDNLWHTDEHNPYHHLPTILQEKCTTITSHLAQLGLAVHEQCWQPLLIPKDNQNF